MAKKKKSKSKWMKAYDLNLDAIARGYEGA